MEKEDMQAFTYLEVGEKHKLQGSSSKCHELLEAAIRGALGDEVEGMGGQSCRG